MTVTDLKEWIYNNNKVEYILESIGCHHICFHKSKGYFSAANPDGDNKTAINIYNTPHLNAVNYTRTIGENSDLITLVSYFKEIGFIESLKYLHEILGLDFKLTSHNKSKEKPADPLDIFKRVRHFNKSKVNTADLEVLEEDVLMDYYPYIHINWHKEDGVMPWTVKKFGLGYSYKYQRNIVPLRYWATGDLLGFNMRTMVENFEAFGISKYFISPNYKKGLNLFGLWENYDSIQKAGYVIVYESEKSVLKRDSRNDATGVALSGHSITDEQVRILIGLNVEIIIALDSDVNIPDVRQMCSRFYRIRNVSYLCDKHGVLGEKDSPADARNAIFDYLLKYKIAYNETEHKKHLKGINKKR